VAPDFYLQNVDNEYNSLSDYKGKIVLLNFWFPGCKPCIKEIPYERELVKNFKDRDFLLINICFFTSKESWISAIQKYKMEGIHLYAVKNWQEKLINEYDIAGYPHYTLIDKKGNIFSNHSRHPSQGIAEDILVLLNE
jgi:thiol-disulfide isomerase/thioredoxin